MSHPCTVPDVTRPSPSFPDTSTPEADAEITAAVRAIEDARDVVKDLIDERDKVLCIHYALGVDARDLMRATSAGGTVKPLSRTHVSRIVAGTPRKPRTANP